MDCLAALAMTANALQSESGHTTSKEKWPLAGPFSVSCLNIRDAAHPLRFWRRGQPCYLHLCCDGVGFPLAVILPSLMVYSSFSLRLYIARMVPSACLIIPYSRVCLSDGKNTRKFS